MTTEQVPVDQRAFVSQRVLSVTHTTTLVSSESAELCPAHCQLQESASQPRGTLLAAKWWSRAPFVSPVTPSTHPEQETPAGLAI